jgi:hypothetical protein
MKYKEQLEFTTADQSVKTFFKRVGQQPWLGRDPAPPPAPGKLHRFNRSSHSSLVAHCWRKYGHTRKTDEPGAVFPGDMTSSVFIAHRFCHA